MTQQQSPRRKIGTMVATHTAAAGVAGFTSAIFTAEAAQNAALLEVVKQAGIGGAMVTITLGFAFAILQTRERHHREENAERSATFAKAFEVQGTAHERDRAVMERVSETLGDLRGTVQALQGFVALLVGEELRDKDKEKRHGDDGGGKTATGC